MHVSEPAISRTLSGLAARQGVQSPRRSKPWGGTERGRAEPPVVSIHRTNELVGINALIEAGMWIGPMPIYAAQSQALIRVLPEWRAAGAAIFVV